MQASACLTFLWSQKHILVPLAMWFILLVRITTTMYPLPDQIIYLAAPTILYFMWPQSMLEERAIKLLSSPCSRCCSYTNKKWSGHSFRCCTFNHHHYTNMQFLLRWHQESWSQLYTINIFWGSLLSMHDGLPQPNTTSLKSRALPARENLYQSSNTIAYALWLRLPLPTKLLSSVTTEHGAVNRYGWSKPQSAAWIITLLPSSTNGYSCMWGNSSHSGA